MTFFESEFIAHTSQTSVNCLVRKIEIVNYVSNFNRAIKVQNVKSLAKLILGIFGSLAATVSEPARFGRSLCWRITKLPRNIELMYRIIEPKVQRLDIRKLSQ